MEPPVSPISFVSVEDSVAYLEKQKVMEGRAEE